RTVEVVQIPIREGVDLEVGEAKEAWDQVIDTIAKQPGLKAFYWGYQVENPEIVEMVIEWESISAHHLFMSDPSYQPMLTLLKTHILDGAPPTPIHILLAPNPTSTPHDPFTMPVTECLRIYIRASYPSPTYTAQFDEFSAALAGMPEVEARGLLGGWSVEGARHEAFGEGEEGKLFCTFMGWPELEAHSRFRKVEGFEKVVGVLSGGLEAVDLVHVKLRKVR
ncbi:hypothetical protein J1614_002202, partial [Plenodomus biglobosus]